MLSVCVIGRNERSGLAECAPSLDRLAALGVPYETIYVDSASSDGSAEFAAAHFDQVLVLAPHAHLNASAGRRVGTVAARGDWIVYLDGDMALSADFLPRLRDLVAGDPHGGVVGHTLNRYPDGSTSLPLGGYNVHGEAVRLFGGACVLPRRDVLDAGNWRAGIYSNEEAELAGRLARTPARIIWYDDVMAEHFTPRIPKVKMLVGLFVPWRGVLGKKYYGVGQVVAAGLRDGTLGGFVRIRWAPFLFLALMAAALAAAIAGWPRTALGVAAFAVAFAVAKGGVRAPIIYLSWLPQLLLGIGRHDPAFRPAVLKAWSRGRGWQDFSPQGRGFDEPTDEGITQRHDPQ